MGFLEIVGFGSGGTASSSSKSNKATAPAVAKRIKNILGLRELDPLPAQAARAFQLASNPKSTGADFISVIESDDALSARVIRVANSVYFFRGTAANDIEKAVANIGLDELRCILSATMLRYLVKGKHTIREQIWANAVGTAICARNLSSRTNYTSSGEAFLAGLVHDVGKLIMIRRGGELYQKVSDRVSNTDETFLQAEEAIFEVDHLEVGKWVAETWNFPPAVTDAISKHHQTWPDSEAQRGRNTSLPVLIKCADTITHAAGIGHSVNTRGIQKKAQNELNQAFTQLGISTEEGEKFIQIFKKTFEEEHTLYQIENAT